MKEEKLTQGQTTTESSVGQSPPWPFAIPIVSSHPHCSIRCAPSTSLVAYLFITLPQVCIDSSKEGRACIEGMYGYHGICFKVNEVDCAGGPMEERLVSG